MSGAAAEAVTALVFDANPATQGAAQFDAAGQKIIAANANVVNATIRTVDAQSNMERALARLTRQIDPAAAAQAKLESGQRLLERAFQRGSISADEQARQLTLLDAKFNGAAQAANRLTVANDAAAVASKKLADGQRFLNQEFEKGAVSAREMERQSDALIAKYGAQAQGIDRVAAAAAKLRAETMVAAKTVVPDRAADIAAYGAELDRLRAKHVPLAAAQQDFRRRMTEIAEVERLGVLRTSEATVAREKAKDAFRDQIRAINGYGAAHTDAAKAVGLTARELQQLSPQIADVGVSLIGGMNPLMVLVQQGPQISDAVGGVGRAFGLLRAALVTPTAMVIGAGLAIAGVTLIAEAQGRALATLSNRLRITRDDYESLAQTAENAARRAAATTTLGTSDARAAASTIAGSRNFTGGEAELTNLLGLTERLSRAMGITAADAATKLAEALNRPRQAAEALAESGLRAMDEATVRTVRSLENQGRVAEAARLVLDAYNRSIGEIAKTPLQRATESLSNSFTQLWQQVQPLVVGIGTGLAYALSAAAQGISALVGGVAQLMSYLRDTNVARFFFGEVQSPAPASASGETALNRQLRLAREANPRFLQQRDNREQYGAARDALSGATGDDARLLRSRLQELNEAYRGMQGPVADYLKNLREQVDLSRHADGADREVAQAMRGIESAGGGAAAQMEALRLARQRLAQEFANDNRILQREITSLESQAEAQASGTRAAQEARLAAQAYNETLLKYQSGDERFNQALDNRVGLLLRTRDAQQALAAAQTVTNQEQQLEFIQRESDLVSAGVVVRERELAILRERQRIMATGEAAPDANDARLLNAGRIAEATQALQRQRSAYEEIGRIGEQAFDRIGSAITTATANGTLRVLKMGNVLRAVASEALQAFGRLAVLNPLKNAISGQNLPTIFGSGLASIGLGGTQGGAAGVSPAGSTSAALQQAGQTGALMSSGRFGNLGAAFTTPGAYSNTGFGFVDSALNYQITPAFNGPFVSGGADVLGSQAAANAAGLNTTGLTAANAIGGAAGLGLGAYSIYSGVQKGGIGGAVGAAGGVAGMVGGAATLGMLGPGLAMLGPYGMAAAAILAIASALLPGQKASGKGQSAYVSVDSGNLGFAGLGGDRFSQENRDAATNAAEQVASLARQLGEKLGGAKFGADVAVGVTSSRGSGPGDLYLDVAGRKAQFSNDEEGSKQLAETAARFIVQQFREAGRAQGDYASILNASGDNMEKLGANLEWYKTTYKSFDKTTEAASAFQQSLDAVTAQFQPTIDKANELSLATDRITAARDKEIAALQKQRDAQLLETREALDLRAAVASGGTGYQQLRDIFERSRWREAEAAVDELQSSLEAMGLSAGETAIEVDRLRRIQGEEFWKNFADSMANLDRGVTSRILRATNRGGEADMLEFEAAAAAEVRSLSDSLAQLGLSAEIAASKIAETEGAIAAERITLQTRIAEEATRTAQEQLRQVMAAGQSVRDYLNGLATNSGAGGVSRSEALTSAQDQFARDLTLSRSNDQEALARITGTADRLLAAGQGMYASGTAYQALRQMVISSLASLPATSQYDAAQRAALGFATGGSFTAAGPAGIDNLSLANVRVTAGETVSVSRQDMMGAVVAELRALRADNAEMRRELAEIGRQQTRVIAAVGEETAEHGAQTVRILSAQADSQRLSDAA